VNDEPPRCHCHGERMRWSKDRRLPAGGYWRCRVRDSVRNKITGKDAAQNARAIRVGGRYLGRAPSAEEAARINARLRALLFDFTTKQKEEYRDVFGTRQS